MPTAAVMAKRIDLNIVGYSVEGDVLQISYIYLMRQILVFIIRLQRHHMHVYMTIFQRYVGILQAPTQSIVTRQ